MIIQRIKPAPLAPAPKNVIIEYEKPKSVSIRQVIEEGIFRADPATYQCSSAHSNGEVRIVDRITDLPIENSRVLAQLKLESSSSSRKINESNHLYTEMINSSNYLNSSQCAGNKHLNNYLSDPSRLEKYLYSYSSSLNNFEKSENVEYETITASVSQCLAEKIIAEAQAAGVINRSSNC